MENITAKVCCFARAYHYKNNETHVFADCAADALLGNEYDQIAKSLIDGISFFLPDFRGTAEEGLRLIVDRQLSPSVLGRSAYCEKLLKQWLQQGYGQYVIFASGYDTFAIRNKNSALSVYELDLPEVIEDKETRITDSNLETCAVSIPCDLSRAGWTNFLFEKGFDPKKKSFGSLLGICYYLKKTDGDSFIGMVSGIMPMGSAICFDYPSENESKETRTIKQLAAGASEQMKAVYNYKEMETILNKWGFGIHEHLHSNAMSQQFFSKYNSSVPEKTMAAPAGVNYIYAVKKS